MYTFKIYIFACQINNKIQTLDEHQGLKGLYCLDFGDCRCQGMMGLQIFKAISKVWPKDLKDNNSVATLVHCLAYCIYLCLEEVTRSCKCIKVAKFKHYKLGTQIPLMSTNVKLCPPMEYIFLLPCIYW